MAWVFDNFGSFSFLWTLHFSESPKLDHHFSSCRAQIIMELCMQPSDNLGLHDRQEACRDSRPAQEEA